MSGEKSVTVFTGSNTIAQPQEGCKCLASLVETFRGADRLRMEWRIWFYAGAAVRARLL